MVPEPGEESDWDLAGQTMQSKHRAEDGRGELLKIQQQEKAGPGGPWYNDIREFLLASLFGSDASSNCLSPRSRSSRSFFLHNPPPYPPSFPLLFTTRGRDDDRDAVQTVRMTTRALRSHADSASDILV